MADEQEKQNELAALVDEVAQSIDLKRQQAIKAKINHIFTQIGIFEEQLRKNANERQKIEEKLRKAVEKITEVRRGNTSILDSINVEEPAKEGLARKYE